MNNPKRGTPILPAEITAAVPGTSAGVLRYSTDVRPCVVSNGTAATLYLHVNLEDTTTGIDNHLIALGAGLPLDVSFNGRINVKSLSVWIGVGEDIGNVGMYGWPPT